MSARACCVNRPEFRNGPSPFREVLAIGYYDGPTEGFTGCETCGTVFRFKLLDWDEGQDTRVFCLSEIRGKRFADLARELLSDERDAASTVRLLKAPLSGAAEQCLAQLDMLEAGERVVVATRDLVTSILVWRRADEGEIAKERDWLTALGIARAAAD